MYQLSTGRLGLLAVLKKLDKDGEKALHIVPSFIELRTNIDAAYVLEYIVIVDKK